MMLANKIVRPADVTQAKAAHFGAEVVHLADMKIEDDVIASVPRHIAKKYRVVPVYKHDNTITVAIDDPSDLNTIDSLTHLLKADVTMQVASEADIENALNKYYGGDRRAMDDGRFKEVIERHKETMYRTAQEGGALRALQTQMMRLLDLQKQIERGDFLQWHREPAGASEKQGD